MSSEKRDKLCQASRAGNADAVQRLLAAGVGVNLKGRPQGSYSSCCSLDLVTPLFCAAEGGHSAIAALLLDAQAEPNQAMRDGRTALHAACALGQNEVATLLLAKGAKDVADKHGKMALEMATEGQHAQCEQELKTASQSVA